MSGSWTFERTDALFDRLSTHTADSQALRRRLHADPRVSGDEDDTTKAVLEALGVEATPVETGGAVVRVGDPEGPAVGLRAEMDALPVVEETGVDWASTNGAMHACGHDVHLAAAYAVARTLSEEQGPLPLVLVLQPREETYPSGGEDMARSAELGAHDIRAFLGAHVQPRLPAGQFAATPGPVNAASDQFQVLVNGRPGHAAYPHLTADPVVAAADLIGTLQHLISRQVDPTNPTVLTIGSINGGNSPNVVPSSVRMKGTLRTFDEDDRTRLHRTLETAADAIASVHRCDSEVQVIRGAPVLANDVHVATAAEHWIERAGMEPAPPLRSCGADDFSFYCPLFPSLMVFVGVGPGGPDAPGLHHPRFLPPDDAVEDVARVMLASYLGACGTVVDLPVPD
ncbi:MAG TPA: M20 family metallopeptidase [Marmoricola sp.]|nr:M20 family metallopeptidase [Marmoricola sp.]